MSHIDHIEYRGNAIFRNQPNHSYFDKPFQDEDDCFFQWLNDIDPHFLKPEQKIEGINISNITVKDPRTQKPITRLLYDHTKEDETKIFMNFQKSSMSEEEHKLGVRVLSRLQQSLEVDGEDMYNWYRLQRKRSKENEFFQKFVYEFNQSKEQIYAPCRKLLELYQSWYSKKVIRLMKRYRQESYNCYLGLPNVRQCKNVLKDQIVKIKNQKIVSCLGDACGWDDDISQELKKFNYSISCYAEVYENSEDLKDSLEDDLQKQFVNIVEQDLEESPNIYIPLESLLFLLTAGDYADMPTEMLLDIKETESATKKYIIMDVPLPSRHCGLHTYVQVVEQASLAMFSLKQENKEEKECLNTNIPQGNSRTFKVSTLQEFMLSSKLAPDKICKFSKTLTKWQLCDLENELLQLYTSLNSFVGNKYTALKLEHKPRLGCEVLTKYEVLREWFKLKLFGASNSSCLRLATTNYQTILEEPLSERKLEECMCLMYRINCNELLNNLFEFLKMLYSQPSGHYMLRYNPKFKDKLMLCIPSKEFTQNTIHLHKLLSSDVSDMEFMSQQNGLQIDQNLCSLMHLQHNIIPAAFSPRAKGRTPHGNNHSFDSKDSTGAHPAREHKNFLNKTKLKRIKRKERLFANIHDKKKVYESKNKKVFHRKEGIFENESNK